MNWREEDWRINIYVCTAQHLTVTVDVDEGTTPFSILCTREGCVHSAFSSFYPEVRPIPDHFPEPSHEWYRPDEEEMKLLRSLERNYIDRGGLLMRERTDAKPVRHTKEAMEGASR